MDNETNNVIEVIEEQQPPKPKKKHKVLFIVIIIVSVIFLAAIISVIAFLPKYFKHKNFKNGIVGEYNCIDTLATLGAMDYGITDSFLEESFVNKITLKIDEDGEAKVGTIDENLKLENTSYNMKQILHNKSIDYETDGKNKGDIGIYRITYYKKGLQYAADKFCEKDRLEVWIWMYDKEGKCQVLLTFEKTDKSTSSSSKSSYSSYVPESKTLLTQSEATYIAEEYLEQKLEDGDVLKGYSKAVTFDTINYGDVSVEYDEDTKSYFFDIKATCWGSDSYGETVDKYKFHTHVSVDAETGEASSPAIVLSKVY